MPTKEQVFEVCARLKAAACDPSIKLIRQEAGGSDRDTSRYLREWREEERKQALLLAAAPPTVQRIMDSALRELWAVAQAAANSALTVARQEHDAALIRAAKDYDDLLGVSDAKDAKLADLQRQLTEKSAQLASAQAEAERSKGAALSHESIHDRVAERNELLNSRLMHLERENAALVRELGLLKKIEPRRRVPAERPPT